MKILCFSDVHLDATTAGLSRWDDLTDALYEVYEAALKEQVDLVIFGGDWCDPGVKASRCVAKAVEMGIALGENQIPSRWLVGNHDVIEDGHGSHVLMPLQAIGKAVPGGSYCEVRDRPRWEVIGSTVFVWLPYTARAAAYDPEEEVERMAREIVERKFGNLPVVVFGHLNIEGIGPGSETKDLPRGREVFLPIDAIFEAWPDALVLSGHYHKRQMFNGVEVVGDLATLTFGEEHDGDKGWLIVEVGDNAEETKDKPKRKRAPRRKRRAAPADA